MAVKKRGLGKGLDALFEDNSTSDSSGSVDIKISDIEPNRDQPRQQFEQEALTELAQSISTHGVLSPLLVRPINTGGYQLVAGERRWRAARMAGLSEVPVIIRELSDVETMEIALIENLQRENLNPVEEAFGYKKLMDEFGFTQEELSKRVNKSRSSIANSVRLLNLPSQVIKQLENGKLSTGHAKVLLGVDDDKLKIQLAEEIAAKGYSVRETEKVLKRMSLDEKKTFVIDGSENSVQDYFDGKPYYKEVEIALGDHLGRKVKVNESKRGGTLTIQFYGKEDLEQLSKQLSQYDRQSF